MFKKGWCCLLTSLSNMSDLRKTQTLPRRARTPALLPALTPHSIEFKQSLLFRQFPCSKTLLDNEVGPFLNELNMALKKPLLTPAPLFQVSGGSLGGPPLLLLPCLPVARTDHREDHHPVLPVLWKGSSIPSYIHLKACVRKEISYSLVPPTCPRLRLQSSQTGVVV